MPLDGNFLYFFATRFLANRRNRMFIVRVIFRKNARIKCFTHGNTKSDIDGARIFVAFAASGMGFQHHICIVLAYCTSI
jgi:hypothetical protein